MPQPGGPPVVLVASCKMTVLSFDVNSLRHSFVKFFSLSLGYRHCLFPPAFFHTGNQSPPCSDIGPGPPAAFGPGLASGGTHVTSAYSLPVLCLCMRF